MARLSDPSGRQRVSARAQTRSEPPQLAIRPSLIDGVGLFALQSFKQGSTICTSKGSFVNTAIADLTRSESRISFELRKNLHFVPTMILEHQNINALASINHSCNPNAYVQYKRDSKLLVLEAQKEIPPTEEITCDYRITESHIAHPFHCNCGDYNCRRLMRW